MEKKNQSKYYRALVVTLIIVLRNIYQIFCPITLSKHMLTTSQYIAYQYNSVINTLMTLLRRVFYTTCIQDVNTVEDTMNLQLACFIKQGCKMFSVKKNLCIQGNIYQGKREITKFCNKLSM